MQPEPHLETVVHAIQLAVAPVFLVTGVSSLLGVLTGRLARVIDRARALEERHAAGQEEDAQLLADLLVLARRARLINWAISLCTACALLVCAVVASLFLGAFLDVGVQGVVGWLFVVAMALLIGGLVIFLREILLATASLQIGPETERRFRLRVGRWGS